MGREAIKVASIDVKKLIDMLNAALSEEWLAYYQYYSRIKSCCFGSKPYHSAWGNASYES